MDTATDPVFLDLIPPPRAIHQRLCDLVIEQKHLRRLLRLSLAAEDDRRRREQAAQQPAALVHAERPTL